MKKAITVVAGIGLGLTVLAGADVAQNAAEIQIDPTIISSEPIVERVYAPDGTPTKEKVAVFLDARRSDVVVQGIPDDVAKAGAEQEVGINETSRTFKKSDGKLITQFYQEPVFTPYGGSWYKVEYATSTVQLAPTAFKLIETAFADTFSPSIRGTIEYDGPQTNWSDMVTAASGSSVNSGTSDYVYAHANGSQYNELDRSFQGFNTASIPVGSTINSASLALNGNFKQTDSAPAINVYSWTHSGGIGVSDFSAVGSTAFSTAIAYASWNTAGTNTFAFNATGLAAITPGGTSYMSLREVNYDVANSAPGTSSNIKFYMVFDSSTGSVPPVLTVTYTAPTTNGYFIRRYRRAF